MKKSQPKRAKKAQNKPQIDPKWPEMSQNKPKKTNKIETQTDLKQR